ncbi:hypothetical protein G6M70_12800 [Agrobacterium tumefaciens]|uniref:COG3904 family protein n=1 Tax=Agrobacterium tumefaciens TaxID=358 RepID=UPI001572AAB7|nr:hypothetical protein [Agrobacterium tumefaciens]NSZ37215.1 hypothetical protein [Agrobacterium tumefaciens]NTB24474.1 hypothetical protein [Agrobacterium tumefaciens]NTB31910.1 hypothetical protein [Agrobacterium tumefaciens]NTB36307.1 hypothetical protein [Agrobacterium tumefaciens]
MFQRIILVVTTVSLAWVGAAHAEITLERVPIDDSSPVLLVKGEFTTADNPDQLAQEVAASGAKLITFNSNGGNVVTAMAYGRMIRSLGLSTLQLRSAECASACALAFVGGVNRQAEPGAIGVHQSSFSLETTIEGHTAVAAIQALTAQIMTYLVEMDVDPKLLQLSLSVPSDDMRYLTASEMQSYKVTWGSLADLTESVAASKVAPTTMPATPKTTEAPPPTTEEKALAFVTAYHDAWSRRNAEALTFMEKVYAETVDFYGKATPKAAVLNEKRTFATRWPVRAYSVQAGSTKVICAETCKVDGIVDWYTKRDVGNRISSGSAEFSLVWDQRAGVILSETGKVVQTDKGVSQPVRLISQWAEQNSACRGGSGDLPETNVACERREAISDKLQTVGWCYGREGEYGYQMRWHVCEATSYKQEGAVGVASNSTFKRPNLSSYPVQDRFSGKTVMPDFKGRDREFNSFRTRIRDGMRQGPNFAGRYTLIQIGCGTGCSFVIVANNQTGRPVSFPRGGEEHMYLTLDFRRDSRLVAAQWLNYDTKTCVIEFFDFDRDTWKPVAKTDVGNDEACYRAIAENLR